MEVLAVPGRRGRGKQAGRKAVLGIGVEADTKAIGVILAAARVLSQGDMLSEEIALLGLNEDMLTNRRRESKDCFRMEWAGSRTSFESRISSVPL